MAFSCPSEGVILQDCFNSYPLLSVNCNLILTKDILFVGLANKGKSEGEEIFLSDVIGCHAFQEKNKSKNETSDRSAYFSIYAYPLKTYAGILSKQLRRDKRTWTFQTCRFENQQENFNLVCKWQRTITFLIRGLSNVDNVIQIPDVLPPPKKFLVLINPKSGQGKAYYIFKERVLPLFVESETQYELLVTDRANCARDYMKKADLSQWDGIVVISGDGLLFEVYNGLMARTDWEKVVKIPVGVIPGGSGNGLAKAINYAISEPYDVSAVTPSILNIIKGHVVPMDLVCVETPKECLYSFLSIGWGLMADIDIESERLRALGEARFTLWAIVRAIGLRRYKGKLSYLPVSDYKQNPPTKAVIEPRPKRSKTIDCHMAGSEESILDKKEERPNMFRSKSFFGPQESDIDNENDNAVRLLKFSYNPENDNFLPDNAFMQDVASPTQELTSIPHLHCNDSRLDARPGDQNVTKLCPPLECAVPDDWVVVDDDFVMVYACHQTHLSSDVLFAPDARLDDGVIWLIVIKSDVSRAQVLYFLSCLQTGDHVNMPYVDVIPVHAFRLEPLGPDGYLTVDGEVIPCSTIQAEVLQSMARVMTR